MSHDPPAEFHFPYDPDEPDPLPDGAKNLPFFAAFVPQGVKKWLPQDRAVVELLLRMPDTWTAGGLNLGSVREAALEQLIRAALVEVAVETTFTVNRWNNVVQSATVFCRTTGRDHLAAAVSLASAAAGIKLNQQGLKVRTNPVLHRLSTEGAIVLHDIEHESGLMQNHALNFARRESAPSVAFELPADPRPLATATLKLLPEPAPETSSKEPENPDVDSETVAPLNSVPTAADAPPAVEAVEPPTVSAPTTPVSVELSDGDAADPPATAAPNAGPSLEDQAIALIVGARLPTIAEVAKLLGVSRNAPYRWKRFMTIYRGLEAQSSGRVRRGSKDATTGEITTADAPTEDDDGDE